MQLIDPWQGDHCQTRVVLPIFGQLRTETKRLAARNGRRYSVYRCIIKLNDTFRSVSFQLNQSN